MANLKLEDWVADCNSVLHIGLIGDASEAGQGVVPAKEKGKQPSKSKETQPNSYFHPLFTYAVFGDEEKVFGFKDLRINLAYSKASLAPFVGLEYSAMIKNKQVHAQDVVGMLLPYLPDGGKKTGTNGADVDFDWDAFAKKVAADKTFVPMGEKVHEYRSSAASVYEIYKVRCLGNERQCDFDTKRFRQFHKRIQTFLLWFIEGATFLEDDDERWQFLVVWKRNTVPTVGFAEGWLTTRPEYEFVGYSSYYPFFHYPDKIRMRIRYGVRPKLGSQFLILPPFQKLGHGKALYNYLYSSFLGHPQVHDITVEDPNDFFQDLRDRQGRHLLTADAMSHSSWPTVSLTR
ncbi:histone acetyltransferase 1 [Kappamyces sp. JEL0680]|nr:histone acetyltransferase 1 [Kappamyces sp. JEL0680]